MSVVMLLAGVCVIIAGLLQLFNRDMAWTSAKWANDLKGVKSERTNAWEYSSSFQAVMVIIGGIVLLALSTQMSSLRNNTDNGNSDRPFIQGQPSEPWMEKPSGSPPR